MTLPRLAISLLTLCCTISGVLHAQLSNVAAEIGGGLSLRGAIGTMAPIPGIPSPGPLVFAADALFVQGFAYAGVDIPVSRHIHAGLRLGGGSTRGGWTAQERIPIARADSVYAATIDHRLTADVTLVNVEPFVRWMATASVHVDLGIPITAVLSAQHRQTQQFADPVGIPFADGSTQQVTSAGTVPGMRMLVPALRARAGYTVPLSAGSLQLLPHVGITYMPFSLHGGTTWRDVAFDVGLALRLGGSPTPPIPAPRTLRTDTLYVRDTVTVLQPGMPNPVAELMDRSVGTTVRVNDTLGTVTITERYRKIMPKPPGILEATIRTVFVDEGGHERTDATIVTKRRRNVVSVAQLPIIVFDSASTTLPDRYIRLSLEQATTFRERDLIDTSASSAVPHWSRHILNIVGQRMRALPRSTVILRTAGNDAVAEARANAVRMYLRDVFGIEPRRLQHDHGSGGVARMMVVGDSSVMVIADPTCDIVGPLVRIDTTLEADLPLVKIYPDVVSDAAISAWSVDVVQAGKVVHTDYGTGAVPPSITWRMQHSVSAERALEEPFEVRLTVADVEGGRVVTDPARIVMREAAIMDASAAVQTSGVWISQVFTIYRQCPQQIPTSGVTRADIEADNTSSAWWLRGVDPNDRPYWNGRWAVYRKPR